MKTGDSGNAPGSPVFICACPHAMQGRYTRLQSDCETIETRQRDAGNFPAAKGAFDFARLNAIRPRAQKSGAAVKSGAWRAGPILDLNFFPETCI
jgi:hypothetical protein